MSSLLFVVWYFCQAGVAILRGKAQQMSSRATEIMEIIIKIQQRPPITNLWLHATEDRKREKRQRASKKKSENYLIEPLVVDLFAVANKQAHTNQMK